MNQIAVKRIAIIGECMIELSGSPFGNMQQSHGGDSLNTAVYLSRTAGESLVVDYVSVLGNDNISTAMRQLWQQEGVGTDLVLIDPTRQPGLYLIQLDAQGERTFLYWRDQSAARYLLQHPDFNQIEEQLANVDMVYLSGISLAILPAEDRSKMVDLLVRLSALGVKVAFDTNYRPALWQDRDAVQQCYQQIFAITDLALVTDDDEAALWGDNDATATLQRLQIAGVKEIVLKQGSKGCIYHHSGSQQNELITTTPVACVVDTTSAGDSFNAGFLAGYLAGLPARDCALQGHQLAAIIIQHKGAIIPAQFTNAVNFNALTH